MLVVELGTLFIDITRSEVTLYVNPYLSVSLVSVFTDYGKHSDRSNPDIKIQSLYRGNLSRFGCNF